MYKKALEVLNIFNEHGYLAYIVGGYVRDMLLDKKSFDIDICASATPREIMELFDIEKQSEINYGSVKIIYKNIKFDVTTFRRDIKYEDNRKPIKIKYIKDLKKDLLRRDFTINTFCIDKDGNILDELNIREDLIDRKIKTVGNPRYKIKEDSLRILRAVRFATILDFTIDDKTKTYIKKYACLLKKLSYQRKKDELNKIFTSPNKERGRELLKNLKLLKYLELEKLDTITMCDDLLGIWAQLDVQGIYPFTKHEKQQMDKIKELMNKELNDYNLYHYGPYLCTIVGQIKKQNTSNLMENYDNLPIKSPNEIELTPLEISKIIEKPAGIYIKEIINDLEKQIISRKLPNNKKNLTNYIIEKYK